MKTKYLLLVLSLTLGTLAHAQLGNFANKLKNKINNKVSDRVDKKVDNKIEEGLDMAEGKTASAAPGAAGSSGNASSSASAGSGLKSSGKFDFVPGEKIIYTTDFTGEQMGELPVKWNTQGKAELVTLNTTQGNWLRLFPTATYLTSNDKLFEKNFTVEFDVIFNMKNTGYTYPYFSFGFLGSGDAPANDNELLTGYRKTQSTEVYIRLASGGGTSTYMETYDAGRRTFITESQRLSALEDYYGKPSHVAVQVQETRLRMWVNGEKKFDLPMALPATTVFNNLFFRTHSSSYKEEEQGFYISNIKVATGLPDTRHKLVEEGKFSTTGILFDVNAATIKPESMGTLKEIADVLKKFPELKVQIIGHTDNDGSDAANLELSKKRSASVKEALVKEFSVDAERMQTDGKGESVPVGDNKTREGKAQNRRVEFIKI